MWYLVVPELSPSSLPAEKFGWAKKLTCFSATVPSTKTVSCTLDIISWTIQHGCFNSIPSGRGSYSFNTIEYGNSGVVILSIDQLTAKGTTLLPKLTCTSTQWSTSPFIDNLSAKSSSISFSSCVASGLIFNLISVLLGLISSINKSFMPWSGLPTSVL